MQLCVDLLDRHEMAVRKAVGPVESVFEGVKCWLSALPAGTVTGGHSNGLVPKEERRIVSPLVKRHPLAVGFLKRAANPEFHRIGLADGTIGSMQITAVAEERPSGKRRLQSSERRDAVRAAAELARWSGIIHVQIPRFDASNLFAVIRLARHHDNSSIDQTISLPQAWPAAYGAGKSSAFHAFLGRKRGGTLFYCKPIAKPLA